MIIIESNSLEFDLPICQLVLNNVGAYVFVKDINRKYIYANKLTEDLFKDRFDSVLGCTDDVLFDMTVSSDIRDNDDKVFNLGEVIKNKEVNTLKATGEQRAYLTVKQPICNRSDEIVGLLGISTDISEIHSLQQELELQATVDELTGLYNRRFFFNLAKKTFSESKRHNHSLSLIMFDIDFFKKINDEHGHPIGDIILKFIGSSISTLLRQEDILARVGGEEFVILLPDTDIDAAYLIAEKVRSDIDSKSMEGDWEGIIEPKISLGISSLVKADTEFYELYTRADKALYEAKYSGRNKVCIANRV